MKQMGEEAGWNVNLNAMKDLGAGLSGTKTLYHTDTRGKLVVI